MFGLRKCCCKSRVHIGNNVVIGSGKRCYKDIPDHVVAAGNPCKVIQRLLRRTVSTTIKT